MKAHDFQKLLFKSAVSIMAADGEIHETELAELKTLVSESAYFLDFEFDAALKENLTVIKSDGKNSINSFLKDLSISDLNKHQQFILVEVLFPQGALPYAVKVNVRLPAAISAALGLYVHVVNEVGLVNVPVPFEVHKTLV